MTSDSDKRAEEWSLADHSGWAWARPAVVPRPTYFPAGTAFGVALVFWGIVTSPVVAGAGGLALVVSLVGWIGEIRHEPEE
jgi:hypothetical protein